MALDELRLSIFTFPQSWDGRRLTCNVLLLPAGDPFSPLLPTVAGSPAFVDARPSLVARVVTPVDLFPATTPPPGSAEVATLGLTTAAAPRPAWLELGKQATNQGVTVAASASPRTLDANTAIRKALPASYIAAAGGNGNSPYTATEDEFGCALLDQNPGGPGAKPPPATNWGELISHALRRPAAAAALGLLRTFTIEVDAADLAGGGWVYVALDPADPAITLPPPGPDGEIWAVRSYAGRLPTLTATAARPVFAAILFPVLSGSTPLSGVADATIEAETYDAGFAALVHTGQADSLDAASGAHGRVPPGSEAGVLVGWDDVQIATWHNRQLDLMRSRQAAAPPAVDVALGVLGYRVDVRPVPSGPAGTPPGPWSSLMLGLQPPSALETPGPAQLVEMTVEPAPVGPVGGPSWLPRYFAQWWGQSLAADDPVIQALTPGSIPAPAGVIAPVEPAVRPLYGSTYEFRTRLVDLSGGGPLVTDEEPAGAGGEPVSRRRLVRHLPPKVVRVDWPGRPVPPAQPSRPGRIDTITVRRPVLGYPEMVFEGASDADVAAVVAAAAGIQVNDGEAIGIDDPAVDGLSVRVEVQAAPHDDEAFHLVYQTSVPFGPIAAPLSGPSGPITLTLRYVDVTSFADLHAGDVVHGPAGAPTAELPVPTGREVRLRLAATCSDPDSAFADPSVTTGLVADVRLRAEEGAGVVGTPTPGDVLAAAGAGHVLQGILLHPSANLGPAAAAADATARLAGRLGLGASGLTLASPASARVVVAATEHVRHGTSGDGAQLTLGAASELWGHWLVALQFTVERDWTWDGIGDPTEPLTAAPAITVLRDDGSGASPVAAFSLPRPLSAGAAALAHDDEERARTHVVVIDAIPITPPADPSHPPRPRPTSHAYRVTAPLRAGGAATLALGTLKLPVAVPPAQVPRLVSAGLAESPYQHADDYSSSDPRTRYMWIEVAEAVSDPLDVLFGRVLAYAPDPLLVADPRADSDPASSEITDPPVPEEAIIVVAPGEANDHAGLDAMTPLVRADGADARHYLVPIPEGVPAEALQLHGLWTYELRIGHGRDLWTTGPARFGRQLRVAGVQHPPPTLRVTATRTRFTAGPLASEVTVSAPFAQPVLRDGSRPLGADGPTTRLAFLVYAQVAKADGTGMLNVLVTRCWAEPRAPVDQRRRAQAVAIKRVAPPWPRGECVFLGREIVDGLRALGLPDDTPVSALAVELLPPTQDGKDPLGADLATQRILRVSPLVPIAPYC